MPNSLLADSSSPSDSRRISLLRKNNWFLPLLLTIAAAAQWLCWETFISGLDSGNYWLGISDYSIADERPHAPGYPAFILLCRATVWLVGGHHYGMLLAVLLMSVGAIWACYRLAASLFGNRVARVAAAFLASNPLFFFYSITTETYAFDALCSSLLMVLSLGRKPSTFLGLGIAVGVSLGFRSTSPVLLAPVLGFLLWHAWRSGNLHRHNLFWPIGGLVIGLGCWLPFVMLQEGGAIAYLRAATNLSADSAGTFLGNLAGFAIAGFWGLNIAWAYLAFRWKALACFRFRQRTLRRGVLWWWIVPIVLFFSLVIYAKGYALLILPGCCLVVAWLAVNEPQRWFQATVIGGVVAANLAIFFLVPYQVPPYFTAFSPRNRTAEQRAESLIGRGVSVLLPTLSHVAANDHFVATGLQLLDNGAWGREDLTLVVVDPAAGMLLVGRVAQVYRPRLQLAVPSTFHTGLVVFLHGLGWQERKNGDAEFTPPQLLLLTRMELAEKYREIGGTLLQEKAPFALLKFSSEQGNDLRQRIDQLFSR